MRILVTGAAGFIGFFTAENLLRQGHHVIGLDNLNTYYDPSIKADRLSLLKRNDNFSFVLASLEDQGAISRIFLDCKPEHVVHLAAQAGVRHSIDHPHDFIQSNIAGFLNILEGCRWNGVEHLVFAGDCSGHNAQSPLLRINGLRGFNISNDVGTPLCANRTMAAFASALLNPSGVKHAGSLPVISRYETS